MKNMNKQMNPSNSIFKFLLKILAVIAITTILLGLSDGISSLISMATLGLFTGPFTFSWWPYFRNEIGLQPLFGIIPIIFIILGIRFRSKSGLWFLAYAGGVMWVIVGFIYVTTHIV